MFTGNWGRLNNILKQTWNTAQKSRKTRGGWNADRQLASFSHAPHFSSLVFQSVCDNVHRVTWSSANLTASAGASLISSWEVFLDPLDELHADFCHVVPPQGVLNEFDIHGHLNLNHTHFQRINTVPVKLERNMERCERWRWAHHLQGSSEDPTEQVGVDERVVVIRQLHKVHQRVVLQDEGEFIPGRAPVGHTGGDSQVHLECILPKSNNKTCREVNRKSQRAQTMAGTL